MSQYSTGAVTTTLGSNVVTGVADANGDLPEWLTEAAAGDEILITGDTAPYTIASVPSDVQLILTVGCGADHTAAVYVICRDFTTNFSLPIVEQGALRFVDWNRRQMQIIDRELNFGLDWMGIVQSVENDPPADPDDGAQYIVGAAPTGAFISHETDIAVWDDDTSEWSFIIAEDRDYVFLISESAFYAFAGGAWVEWELAVTVITMPTEVGGYAASFTDASLDGSGNITITHGLNSTDLIVQVKDNNGQRVNPDAVVDSGVNAVILSLATFRPLAGSWRVIVK